MRLVWSSPSIADLLAIDLWLTENTDKALSETLIGRIRSRARRLRDFPRTGRALSEGWRTAKVPRTPYWLVYTVDREIVEILRIRHNREDWREA